MARASKRNFFATSSCGVCGKATLEQVAVRCPPVEAGPVIGAVGPHRFAGVLCRMRKRSSIGPGSARRRGCSMSKGGCLSPCAEDVGRHERRPDQVGRSCTLGWSLAARGADPARFGTDQLRDPAEGGRGGGSDRVRGFGAFDAPRFPWLSGWGSPWWDSSEARASTCTPTRIGSTRGGDGTESKWSVRAQREGDDV